MNQGLSNFDFKGAPVRAVLVNGEPWWVARDVCNVLELVDVNRSVARLDDDDKGTHIVSTPGGPQEVTVVNESGLYSLILRSRKPEAKTFKRWVTSEVIPSIRRTGAYVAPGVAPAPVPAAPVGDAPAWMAPFMAALTQNLTVLTGKSAEVEAIAAGAATKAQLAVDAASRQAQEVERLKAELADRDVFKRQQLRNEVESIKKQVFAEMTRRGMGVQKVAHDFWEGVKGRAGVSSVKVECLTVTMAQRLFVEAKKQAQLWGVSIVLNLPLDLQDAS